MLPRTNPDPLPTSALWRTWSAVAFQRSRARSAGCLLAAGGAADGARLPPACSDHVRGKTILVTGASRNVGEEVALVLLRAGARVLAASRSEPAHAQLRGAFEPLDLADAASIHALARRLSDRGIVLDEVVLNAAVIGKAAYRTNVLGNALLVSALLRANALRPDARLVFVTGDIYITERNCTADFPGDASRSYARSKLGVNWYALELQRRRPDLEVCLVHPGVVASDLFRVHSAIVDRIRRLVLLSASDGAAPVALAASVPSAHFVRGGYLVNTLGWCAFESADPSSNAKRRAEFWGELARKGAAL